MSVYYLLIIFIGIFAFFSSNIQMQHQEIVMGEKVWRYTWFWAIVAIVPLVYFTSIRSGVGDTDNYISTFFSMPESFAGIASYMDSITKDKGFYLMSAIIKAIFGENRYIYFFIVGSIQAGILAGVYRKYSTRYVLSIFLFLVSTDYISWMFNGMRQFLAVTVTFAACSLILKKKYVPAIIVIIIASTLHGTALLMIPFIFVVQGKPWNKKTIFFLIIAFLAIIFIGQSTNLIDTMLQETQYQNVVSDWKEWQDDGTNVLRVLVYSIPTILSLIGYRYIKIEDDPLINVCVNMSIIATGLYIVSMFTSGIFIGRLPIYFSLYNYILLPWEIEHIFTKESAVLMRIIMIIAYLGFYIYSLWTVGF